MGWGEGPETQLSEGHSNAVLQPSVRAWDALTFEVKSGEGARQPGEHDEKMSGRTGAGQSARIVSH